MTGRIPSDPELDRWIGFTEKSRSRFAAAPEDAASFLAYGEAPRNAALPEAELAALACTMSAALNLDETIARD